MLVPVDVLRRKLVLPDDASFPDAVDGCIRIVVEHAELPEIPPGQNMPEVAPVFITTWGENGMNTDFDFWTVNWTPNTWK
jgi:hypothetical protein